MKNLLHVGLDVGSTTVKVVVMNGSLSTIYTSYQRHNSDTKNTVCAVLDNLTECYPNSEFTIALTGSGAMSAANFLNVPFIQEVVSCKRAVEKYIPATDVVIELGGEDATDEGAQRDARNCEVHRHQRLRCRAPYEQLGNRREEEHVHQVHTEAQLGNAADRSRRALALYAGEEQESAEGGKEHVRGAEFPGPLQQRSLDEFARRTHIPE